MNAKDMNVFVKNSSFSRKWVFMKLCLYLLLANFSSTVTFAQVKVTGTTAKKYVSNKSFNIKMKDLLNVYRDFTVWGIKADVQTGGYVKLKIMSEINPSNSNEQNVDFKINHTIAYVQHTKPNVFDYVAEPGFIYNINTSTIPYEFGINLPDRNLSNKQFTFTKDSSRNPLWYSDNITAGILRAWGYQQKEDNVVWINNLNDNPTLEVIFELEIKDANVNSINLPGYGEIPVNNTLFGRGVIATVTSKNGTNTKYIFSELDVIGAQTITPTSTEFTQNNKTTGTNITVKTVEGDKVVYSVYGLKSRDLNTKLLGVPTVYPITFAAQRQFLTIPDSGPNQYYPWFAFEAQTHFRKINSYPNKFVVKSDNWDFDNFQNNKTLSWTWTAQRQTDPGLTKYQPNVYYPKVRGSQRDSQSLGWAAQFLYYYNLSKTSPGSVPKYITGFDIDDWLIPQTNVALTAFNYTELDGTTTNQNWQHMWDNERLNVIKPAADDIVVNNLLGGGNYPLTWDGKRGFPKAGFTTNDMITAYQKHKAATDDDANNNLPSNYYFNGYEIEDSGTHYVNKTSTPSVYTTALKRDVTGNKPAPCDFGCWYNDANSTGNTKNPGVVSVVFNDVPGSQPYTISFRQEVTSALQDPVANPTAGFFGSLEGDQYPMGYGNESTYTLKGVKQEDFTNDRISLCMLEYQDGAMLPVKVLKKADMTYNAGTKKLSGKFKIYSAWMAIAAYYKTGVANDSVIIAGRVPMVFDPLTSLTIPGSNANPYDNKSLAPNGFVDLKEGQGDRSFETMNEFRKSPDYNKGYTTANGEGFSRRYVRSYVLDKGSKVKFSCIGPGRKIQSFWNMDPNVNADDPYQSWRELAKRMPQDIVGQRVKWSVFKIDPNTGSRLPTAIANQTTRHFDYTFAEDGEYEIQLLFNGDVLNPTMAYVKVKDFDSKAVSTNLADLKFSVDRGEAEISLIDDDERKWLVEYGAMPATGELNNYRILEVKDLPSYYTYVTAPRANTFQHREGAFNDMNNVFKWYVADAAFNIPTEGFQPANFTTTVSSLANTTPAANFIKNFVPESVWPASWSNIWVNHIPSKATDASLTGYTRLFDGKATDVAAVETNIGNTFQKLQNAQSVLGWIRWYPWIAKSPSEGYKINRYVKTTLNIRDFLDNNNMGVFSGKAGIDIGNVSNAVASMDWYDYGSPEAQRPGAEEIQRHLSDELKNKLEFYNDLKAGRKIVVNINTILNKKIIALNANPIPATGKPAYDIFITSKLVKEAPVPTNVEALNGTPILTFSGARLDRLNDLNAPYTITAKASTEALKPKYKIVHNGVNRFLEVTAPALPNALAEQSLTLDFDVPPFLRKEVGTVGFQVSMGSNVVNSTIRVSGFYVSDTGVETQIGLPQVIINGSNMLFNNASVINSNKLRIKISRSPVATTLLEEILTLDNVTLLRNNGAYKFTKPNFISTDATIKNASISWLKNSVYRFFDWNFVNVGTDKGVFLEAAYEDKVSLSGLGMGIATTILAKEDGRLTDAVAKERVNKVLKWIDALNTNGKLFNGVLGWHGMPNHYYDINSNLFGGNIDISTVDWAICAQGIRLARQYYSTDTAIKNLCTRLLLQVDWSAFQIPSYMTKTDNSTGEKIPDLTKTIYQDLRGRIVLKGDAGYETQSIIDDLISQGKLTVLRNRGRIALNVNDKGEVPITGNAWGQTFTEEAELVYLEVLASNKEKLNIIPTPTNEIVNIDVDGVIYIDKTPYEDVNGKPLQKNEPVRIIYRKKKFGFIPNRNGSGFTYNWLQLWMGSSVIPGGVGIGNTSYFDNSVAAYKADRDASFTAFGKPYMGLTAASTVSNIQPNGFIKYGNYLGKQGSDKNLSPEGEVVQLAPAPYGAALALPFLPLDAFKSLQEYVNLGYYHEYIGLPDNIVIKNIGAKLPLPNWEQLDINIAPIAMSFDAIGKKIISNNLRKDFYLNTAYPLLYNSFARDFKSTEPVNRLAVSVADKNISEQDLDRNEVKTFDNNLIVYPNPSRDGQFTVQFDLEEDGPVSLTITDFAGRVAYQNSNDILTAGSYRLLVNSQAVSSGGVYFMTFKTNKNKTVRKLIIQK